MCVSIQVVNDVIVHKFWCNGITTHHAVTALVEPRVCTLVLFGLHVATVAFTFMLHNVSLNLPVYQVHWVACLECM